MKERNNPWMKRLDKWIGCPLLFALGVFHQKQEQINLKQIETPRIALIKTAAIGDTIVLSAMVDEIKRQYPRSRITVICSKNNLAMVKLIRHVDDTFVFVMKKPFQSFTELRRLGHFDLLLDFGPWPRINAVISWMIHADYKVGFKRAHMHRHYVYDRWVEHLDTVHEIDNYRNVLRAAGLQPVGLLPFFEPAGHDVPEDTPYVVFHLYPGGAMENQRKWSECCWVELGGRLHQMYQVSVLLSGAPADTDAAEHTAHLLRQNGVSVKNIAGMYSLDDMVTVLTKAALVVSVNTGIMHLAAAVRAPLVALHGATSELRWGPLGDSAVVVKSGEPCQPCISLGFESDCENPICMKNITVDMVMEKIHSLMSRIDKGGVWRK